MRKTNYLRNIGEVIFSVSRNADNFLDTIHVNEVELLNLAGGIPKEDTGSLHHTIKYSPQAGSLMFSSNCELFLVKQELFWQDSFIENKYLRVFATGRRTATAMFVNEVVQARKLGIAYLKVSAARADGFNGYYTWARLGYSMEGDDQELFTGMMQKHGRKEKSIIQLMETAEGRKFWREKGFWWQGVFDLSAGSENIQALNSYLRASGFNVLP